MIQLYSLINSLSFAEKEQSFQVAIPDGIAGVRLKTCNRVELYSGDGFVSGEIVRHLFRVVSGLESHMLGEMAIQGQVKLAYAEACSKFKLDKTLHQLFQTAFFVGKRVRTESGISIGATSHSQAAANIITKSGLSLKNAIISFIGVHKLNEDIIKFLQNKGAETIFLANKSHDKAAEIASKYGCTVMRFDKLKEMLSFSDILISATSAPHLIVQLKDFPTDKKMLIIDLAFPRDVDDQIGFLPGVDLYNLEDVEKSVCQNLKKRKEKIVHAEEIIEEEVKSFLLKQSQYAYQER